MAKYAIENSIEIVTAEQQVLIDSIAHLEQQLAKKKARLVQTENAVEDLQKALTVLQAQSIKEI